MLINKDMSNSLPLKLKGYLLSKSMHNSKAKERNKKVSQLVKLKNKTMSKNRNNNRDNNKNKNRERSKLKNRLLLADTIISTSVLLETMNQGLLWVSNVSQKMLVTRISKSTSGTSTKTTSTLTQSKAILWVRRKWRVMLKISISIIQTMQMRIRTLNFLSDQPKSWAKKKLRWECSSILWVNRIQSKISTMMNNLREHKEELRKELIKMLIFLMLSSWRKV